MINDNDNNNGDNDGDNDNDNEWEKVIDSDDDNDNDDNEWWWHSAQLIIFHNQSINTKKKTRLKQYWKYMTKIYAALTILKLFLHV